MTWKKETGSDDPVSFFPFSRRHAHHVFEGAGEMKLIFIPDPGCNVTDREVSIFHQIAGHVDAVADDVFLRSDEHGFFKNFPKIAAVEIAPVGEL